MSAEPLPAVCLAIAARTRLVGPHDGHAIYSLLVLHIRPRTVATAVVRQRVAGVEGGATVQQRPRAASDPLHLTARNRFSGPRELDRGR